MVISVTAVEWDEAFAALVIGICGNTPKDVFGGVPCLACGVLLLGDSRVVDEVRVGC